MFFEKVYMFLKKVYMFFEKVCMFFKKYICFLKKYVCFLKKYIFFEKAYIFFVRLLLVHRRLGQNPLTWDILNVNKYWNIVITGSIFYINIKIKQHKSDQN